MLLLDIAFHADIKIANRMYISHSFTCNSIHWTEHKHLKIKHKSSFNKSWQKWHAFMQCAYEQRIITFSICKPFHQYAFFVNWFWRTNGSIHVKRRYSMTNDRLNGERRPPEGNNHFDLVQINLLFSNLLKIKTKPT